MSMQFDITVLSGVSTGDVFHYTLEVGSQLGIGRSPDNELVLQDPIVSRKHAAIKFDGSGLYLHDLGSSTGTVYMGFKLAPGGDGARRLSDCDEFKIGDALFRIALEEEEEEQAVKGASAAEEENEGEAKSLISKFSVAELKKNKKLSAGIGLVVVLLLVLLLIPEDEPPFPLPQLSNVKMDLPKYRIIGYLAAGKSTKKRKNSDKKHLDKAQFELAATDLAVEFEYKSEVLVKVLLDNRSVLELPPSPQSWQHHKIIIRDQVAGQAPLLVFDNTAYDSSMGFKVPKKKKWALKDIRYQLIKRKSDDALDAELRAALGLTERLDKNPEALHEFIQMLHRAILQTLIELRYDTHSVFIDLDSMMPPASEIKQTLKSMVDEQAGILQAEGGLAGMTSRHLEALSKLLADCESELWRRASNRFTRAKLAAKAKNYIDAHDHLMAAMKMFSSEADFRWRLADEMLHNKKIVPKNIRDKPFKYRRKRMQSLGIN